MFARVSAIVLALVASASAFAPSMKSARSSALKMSFENEVGALPPTGFFDPLGKSIADLMVESARNALIRHSILYLCMSLFF